MGKNTPKIYLLCSSVFALGLFLSILLYVFVDRVNTTRKERLLIKNFKNIEHRVQHEIDHNLNALYTLRAYYLASGGFSRDEFTSFGSFFTDNIRSIQALEWVPRIKQEERDSFEESTRKEGFPDFEIFTRTKDGKVIRAEERPVYYPIHYIHPFVGNEAAFGYDPGSALPLRKLTIESAIETKAAAASDIVEIIQKDDPHKAILVFVPVYEEDILIGFIEGVYLIDHLIDAALEGLELSQQFIVSITSKTDSTEILYESEARNRIDLSLKRSSELQVADQSWIVQLTGSNDSFIHPIWFLVGSMVLTTLLVKVVYNTLRDNRRVLIKNLQELKQKNEDLEQYAYVASHDLQEPLHSLQSLVSLIQDDYKDQFDEIGLQYLTYLHESSERMSLLIKNLLNYSRIGRMEDPKMADLNNLVEKVTAELGVLIKESNAEVIIKNKLPKIKGYPLAIHQLFQNLISNAVKFQPPGQKAKVTISYVEKNSKPLFKVEDNGIGIPLEYQEKVFVIFKRLHNSAKYKGTGVGLANCKKIVDLHKGDIWIKSEEGKGSIFYFTLNL